MPAIPVYWYPLESADRLDNISSSILQGIPNPIRGFSKLSIDDRWVRQRINLWQSSRLVVGVPAIECYACGCHREHRAVEYHVATPDFDVLQYLFHCFYPRHNVYFGRFAALLIAKILAGGFGKRSSYRQS